MNKLKVLITILVLTVLIAGCGNKDEKLEDIKVGYFPNISHAPAMVGVENNIFADQFKDITVSTQNFPNGSLFMDALSTGQIDIGYVGPGPVINRYLQGGEVVVLANASKGENVLVVRNDVAFNDLKDLEGKIIATPSTGCTHDLILRKMLQDEGLAVEENGGTVKRIAQKPATMMGLFEQKQIDGALVSEPWASLMEAKGVARVVRDAKEVPWGGDLPATILVVRKDFLEKHPNEVKGFLSANQKSIDFINENKEETVNIISKQIKAITGQEIQTDVIKNALGRVEFTSAIHTNTMQEFANLSKDLGFITGDSSLDHLFWDKISK